MSQLNILEDWVFYNPEEEIFEESIQEAYKIARSKYEKEMYKEQKKIDDEKYRLGINALEIMLEYTIRQLRQSQFEIELLKNRFKE